MNRLAVTVIFTFCLTVWYVVGFAQQPVIIPQGDSLVITSQVWLYPTEENLTVAEVHQRHQDRDDEDVEHRPAADPLDEAVHHIPLQGGKRLAPLH